MAHFVTRYDFRAPGADPARRQEIFARAVEQAAYLDAHGEDAIMLSEHHASDDGYLPSPIPVAAAIAAVTQRVPITVSALLANLYDPVRLAEDIAVLDHLAAGRVSFTIGLGYRPEEYEHLGRPWATRGADLEAAILVLQRAWTGEPFEHEGRTVRVTPTPYSQPHPMLFYGGGSLAAARRAGRLGLHFAPQHGDPALHAAYEEECRAQGREPGISLRSPRGPAHVFCADDPDAFWGRYGHHLLADATGYAAWRGHGQRSYVQDDSRTVEEMRAAGGYVVLTADQLVEQCRSKEIRLVTSHPACGGLPAEPSWESVRLISEVVRPALAG
ncbi:LLM class flavin-dependent oxidoreductase [Nocardioides sp. cx-173]|uniref:LLM class flavin-dependent oxidoreductase n=1 Tax=Nocardioides sp. cx-173 TaxID=2898796 RepID=UPI001E4AAD6C|nr:LLM class flavin-dependent oxidoreductase [Nocardioides sp. cx-173]MCD4523819.1 LLM class flavin-dependent oxidoreductase [Nocardioides sp. cx-173]UGB41860.1 LLM class flavin-dependent oxidoreductase [Nocardioides sp. cx-173]